MTVKNVCKSAVVITKKSSFFSGVACFVTLKNQLKGQFL